VPYNNFVANSFHTKKFCGRLSSSDVQFYTGNGPFCVFEPLHLEGLGTTYDDHLIGKCVVDFLLVLIELFSLGVTAFYWDTILGFSQNAASNCFTLNHKVT